MADIKQAAKWMQQGKRVKRSYWSTDVRSDDYHRPWLLYDKDTRVMTVSRGGNNWSGPDFIVDDLLADDWEIAH